MERKITIQIGQKIKELRKLNNLSLHKLAGLAQISPSGLYKIENNGYAPSITTLIKIANALEKRVSYFVDEEESTNVQLIKKDERRELFSNISMIKMESFSGGLKDCLLEAAYGVIEPGGNSGKGRMSHKRGEELVICIKGKVEYKIGSEKFVLQKGDSIHFKSEIPHSWKNLFSGKSIIIWVLTPPTF